MATLRTMNRRRAAKTLRAAEAAGFHLHTRRVARCHRSDTLHKLLDTHYVRKCRARMRARAQD